MAQWSDLLRHRCIHIMSYYCHECKADPNNPCSHIEEALYQDELIEKAVYGVSENHDQS